MSHLTDDLAICVEKVPVIVDNQHDRHATDESTQRAEATLTTSVPWGS